MPRAKKKPPLDRDAVIAAVRAVPGIADADVDPDGRGPGRLRISLVPGHDEAEVAEEVGRVLREQFGLGVDDEAVVVEDAEIRPARSTAVSAPADLLPRPSIDRMHIESAGETTTAVITIGLGDRTEVGEATDATDEPGVCRAVAAATLLAVDQLADGVATFTLDRVDIAQTGADRTAVVAVSMLRGDERTSLTGAAVVRDDPRQAVIRACLDAVNRRLGLLLAGR
ncbi:MAG TPA: hypothetical protein VNA12_08680 [Mycobacteriales bacterium]|nr:hypothetical protein [Mycobacteriales bacterium]